MPIQPSKAPPYRTLQQNHAVLPVRKALSFTLMSKSIDTAAVHQHPEYLFSSRVSEKLPAVLLYHGLRIRRIIRIKVSVYHPVHIRI